MKAKYQFSRSDGRAGPLFCIYLVLIEWLVPISSVRAQSYPPDASIVCIASKQSKIVSIKTDPYSLASSTDIRIHPTTNSTQSEMSAAVSPLNSKIVLVSANATDYPVTTIYGTGAYWSTNGGETWAGFDQPPTGNNRGDPAAAVDRNGYLYIGSIAPNSGQGIMKSTNNGSNWTYIQVANPTTGLLDKNHLTVDNSLSSSFLGNLYSAWSDFSTLDRAITVKRSTNKGDTWIDQQVISSGFAGSSLAHQGVNLQTGPDGTVYACWAVRDRTSPFTERGIGFNKSTNGGQTWGTPYYAINNILGMRRDPYPVLGIRTNSFPTMGVDRQTGKIYLAWVNIGVPGTNTGDPDVYLISSTNGGVSWSTPVRVNTDQIGNGAIQFHCWLAVDPLIANNVYVGFFDNRLNIGTNICNYYVAQSTDGGQNWTDFAVSDASFTVGPLPNLGNYNGDYSGIAVRTGMGYPVWHSQVPSVNAQAWTSVMFPVNLSIQNTTVSEAALYEASNSITAGPAFTATNSANVTFHVTITGTPGISLEPGFSASAVGGSGTVFRAYIGIGSPESPLFLSNIPTTTERGQENKQGGEMSSKEIRLLANYPNPFNPATRITFRLAQPSNVTLKVFDIVGKEVATLVNDFEEAGDHSVTFDASQLASGVYFYKMVAGNYVAVKKLVVMK